MNITAHQQKEENEETKKSKREAAAKKKRNRRLILKKLCAALLRSFRGQHSDKIKGSARDNWDPRESNNHFDPTQTGPGTAPPR